MKSILFIVFACVEILYSQNVYNRDNYIDIFHLDSLGIFHTETIHTNGDMIYISDYASKVVYKMNWETLKKNNKFSTIGYGKGSGPGENKGIVAISSFNDVVYIADRVSAKISKWKNSEYIGDYDLGNHKVMPSYITISDYQKSLFIISSVFEKDVSVYEYDLINEGKIKNRIKIESNGEDFLFIKDSFMSANDSLLVITPMNDPFMYIYNCNSKTINKVRTSNLIEQNTMLKEKNFLGQKSITAKHQLYFNSSVHVINNFIYIGLSESEFVNINKIVKYDLNGLKISEVTTYLKPLKFYIYNDKIHLMVRYDQKQYNKIYVYDLF